MTASLMGQVSIPAFVQGRGSGNRGGGVGKWSGSQPGSVSASTEINAPNLNSEKTVFNDSPRDLRPASSLLLVYLFILIPPAHPTPPFLGGADFLIIRLRITRPVGEGDFLFCHTARFCFYQDSFIRDPSSFAVWLLWGGCLTDPLSRCRRHADGSTPPL